MNLFLKERLMMMIRGVPSSRLISAYKKANANGIDVGLFVLENQYLAGGDPVAVVDQLINAGACDLELEWDRACAIDLCTKGTKESLSSAVLGAISIRCDTFELSLSEEGGRRWSLEVSLTHKLCLDRFIGGADISVLTSRVKNAIEAFYSEQKSAISTSFPVGAFEDEVMKKSLDLGTRFELVNCKISLV
tara:strand:- start:644 stop:1216 length:573 start_codon:yes stop_codon:yes gene_type:complete